MSLSSSKLTSGSTGSTEIVDSLIKSLAKITESTVTDTTDLQSLLCSLGEFACHTDEAQPGLGLSSPNVSNYASRIDYALEACHGDLDNLVELVKSLHESSNPSSTCSQDATGLGQEISTTEKDRDHVINLKKVLNTHLNTLKLTTSLNWRSQDAAAIHRYIEVVQGNLEDFCKELFHRMKGILPPAAAASGVSNICGITLFTVHEIEVAATISQSINKLACPRAGLYKMDQTSHKPSNMRFRCYCEGNDHNDQLKYKVIPEESLLIEQTEPGMDNVWQILLLRKPNSRVLVRLSKVHPTPIVLRALSNRLAMLFVRGLYPTLESGNLSKPLLTLSSEESVSVQNMASTAAFLRLKPSNVQFIANKRSFILPWKPGYIKLLHYVTASKDWLDSTLDGSHSTTRQIFLPEPYFFLVFSNRPPFSSKKVDAELDLYRIPIYQDTMVLNESNPKGPLHVTLVKVHCIHEGSSLESHDCSEIHIKFSTDTAAKAFDDYIKFMKYKVLSKSFQQACWGERTLYRQDTETLMLDSSELSRAQFSIVSSPKNRKLKCRMIMMRDGISRSLCFDFGSKFFEVIQNRFLWFQPNLDVRVRIVDYDKDSGQETVKQSKWDKMIALIDAEIIPPNHAPNLGSTYLKRHDASSSEDWFQRLEDLICAMKAPKKRPGTDSKYEKVKVAIIDTGVDPEYARKLEVRYKDFLHEEANDMKDNTGHGTISVNLILRMYDDAELYMARVFETNQADNKKGPDLMTNAINWAVENKVDIISISAGFEHSTPGLRKAIQRADGAGILVFAAAANWGNTQDVAFPARFKDYVMCIFSTNTLLQSSLFNPEPRDSADNFAILGEDIKMYPEEKPYEGTSMATAIAAGLAARILDFTRHTDTRDVVKHVGTKMGMTAIFNAMSKPTQAGYKCVAPWTLMKAQYNPEVRLENRIYVRDTISRALEKVT